MRRFDVPTLAVALSAGLLASAVAGCGSTEPQPAASTEQGSTPSILERARAAAAEGPRLAPPLRGEVTVEYTEPDVERTGNAIVTTIRLRNASTTGAIAGLEVEETWYDGNNNLIPGDTQRIRQPLQPGDVVEVVLTTPIQQNMQRNTYNFSHANGSVNAELVEELEAPTVSTDEAQPEGETEPAPPPTGS